MAVYKRTYRGYSGPLTSSWLRFLVLYRFARQSAFRSKFQTVFFVLCFFFPLLALLGVYTNAHMSVLSMLTKRAGPFIEVNSSFFLAYESTQGTLAFLLTAFIGPGLISPDLANGALTLYLSRPLSRAEYICGKLSVLVITLSWITWVPGLVIFFAQSSLGGWQWFASNYWLAGSIVLSSLVWIFILSLISLALSAWVKWRIVAGALLLAVVFLGAGFAQAINGVLGTSQGYLFDVGKLVSIVQHGLFCDNSLSSLSIAEAWVALAAISGICLLLLTRKIKPNEVVR